MVGQGNPQDDCLDVLLAALETLERASPNLWESEGLTQRVIRLASHLISRAKQETDEEQEYISLDDASDEDLARILQEEIAKLKYGR